MSEDAAAQRADVARTLRHDLRTPVNHITGFSELLLEDAQEAAPELVPALQEIRAAATRALALIDELAARASAEDAANAPTPASEALAALARDVAVRCDAIGQATGGGAMAADLHKIGTAARQLVELIASHFPVPHAPDEPIDDSGPGVVLVVDDNELNRDMLSRRLQRLGYRVLLAEDGLQALDVLQHEAVDVMLLDIMMPSLDGYGVLERRQGDARLREIPAIMISAVDEIDSVARCITLGAEDYLPKPFNPVLLKARLDASFERKRRRDRELAALRVVAQLTDAAAAVDAGTFDAQSLADLVSQPGPLAGLARVLTRMAGTVREREEQLRTQLRERSYVFLSYASTDRKRVEPLIDLLAQAGVRVWVDRHDIAAGTTWSAEIVQSIRGCAALLIACSPAAMASRNVKQEIQLAWKYNRPYVPLILEATEFPAEVEYQLEGCQWVDVYDHAPEMWLPPLLLALKRLGAEGAGVSKS